MSEQRPKVAFVVLDAFPFSGVDPNWTPCLFELAQEGGISQKGGEAVLSASTYPNHASLITGAMPFEHGIFTSHSWLTEEPIPAKEAGPACRTLFDDCRDAQKRAIAIVGDQNLIGACGARAAAAHWPNNGDLPESAPRGRLGYGADRGVVGAFDELDPMSADFTFVQLDEVDTERHLRGPWNDDVREQCRLTDSALGELLERFRSMWSEMVIIVVSDHDHEKVESGAIDLKSHVLKNNLNVQIDHDGTSALVVGRIDHSQLLDFPSVVGAQTVGPDRNLVWGDPGVQFGQDWNLAAQHGSPRTAKQLAVVGGGHPEARRLGNLIQASRPQCTEWAHWIRRLLVLDRHSFEP